MPNWCENKLTVYGTESDISVIKESLIGQDEQGKSVLDFNCLTPMPLALKDESYNSAAERASDLLALDKSLLLTDEIIEQYIKCIFLKEEHLLLLLSLCSRQGNWRVADFIQWLASNTFNQQRYHYDLALGQVYLNNLTKYGAADCDNWCKRFWGCKWNANTVSLEFEETALICFFDTPWSPPECWFEKLCTSFPHMEIKLEYLEQVLGFGGVIENVDGNAIQWYLDDVELNAFAQEVFGMVPDLNRLEDGV